MKLNWFPGHMHKSHQLLIEMMPKVDIMIEVLDARLPFSSANPMFTELRGHKPCIKLLNKNDLADPVATRAWVTHFEQEAGVRALPIEATRKRDVDRILKLCRQLVPNRGEMGKAIRALVVGIPNVGKSTLINTMTGRKIARTGDRPAVTTCPQQIELRNGIRLFDSPGLLWPNLDYQQGAYRLAASGAIGDAAIDPVDIGRFAAEFMAESYPKRLTERYNITEFTDNPDQLLEEIGTKRGCLVSGGTVNMTRAAELLLREVRSGKMGQISFETPESLEQEKARD
ncbi:MAG: ribosome biogenesis GTPase YlqF [Desulfuromonadales bacterium]|nr:ribosome biogenesis GTPase YlqF [Desulfuromonadales bacterium]